MIFVFFYFTGFAQKHHLEVKYIGLGWHPTDETLNAENMPLKFDKNGNFMLNIGLCTSWERYFKEDGLFSLEMMGAFYLDCAMIPDGIAHVGFRGTFLKFGKHSMNGGVGPTLLLRRNWYSKLPDYVSSGYFKGNKENYFQWKFIPYGGELEYNYHFDKNNMLSVSFIPGFPKYVALFFGYEYSFGVR